MSRKTYSIEEKLEILETLKEEHSSYKVASLYKVHHSTIMDWKYKWDTYGLEGLKESVLRKNYSIEQKLSAIKDYVSGHYSIREITRMYGISDASVLRNWIRKYNSHSELKDTSERTSTMTNGRKTTWEERIQIVLDCLEHGKDYQRAADIHQVSYQQVYKWVKKFEVGGEKALVDRRGNTKEEVNLTPEEKIILQMRKLERENERLRAENLFLKKLEEIERRRK